MSKSLKDEIRAICEETQGSGVPAAADETAIRNEAAAVIRAIISGMLKIPLEMLEDDSPLDEYGIDSMLNQKIIERIEAEFGPQRKTLLYEYNTIQDLAEHLAEKSADRIRKRLEEQAAKAKPVPPRAEEKPAEAPPVQAAAIPSSPPAARRQEEPVMADDIAVIGLSGRYPGARNAAKFWENLVRGKDSVTEIPSDRWSSRQYFGRFGESEMPYLHEGGFMDGVYEFDPMFFSIAPNEARDIEPQERQFLECCYEAMEDAGYTREKLGKMTARGHQGSVGVFAGALNGDYRRYSAQEQALGNPVELIGDSASISNRVSYFLNIHGPSFTLDTMCSASLTALHLACRSIREGECAAALVGGVNLIIHPIKYHILCKGKFASTHGRCESFGKDGDGYVPGEGVGVVMIRPLRDAVAAGDHIYGVIKGTAINHGGKTSGYTVPNPNAQAEVIEQAMQRAGVTPETVSYIEAHGTGTKLGDPIEITGLEQVFRKHTEEKQFCAIGSVKSNIGHTEAAAGMAGLTKVLLQMKAGKIVPSLHSRELNPLIDFAASPFFVPQELQDWERPTVTENGRKTVLPRRAGISSFGAGGANSHVIVEEYAPAQVPEYRHDGSPLAVVLSARTEEQLETKVKELSRALRNMGEDQLLSVVYTLQTGREVFPWRLGFCAGSMKTLRETLDAWSRGDRRQDVMKNRVIHSPETVRELEKLKTQAGEALAERDQQALARLFVAGADVDWEQCYPGGVIEKISLPTYPFERTVYAHFDKMKDLLFPSVQEADGDEYKLMTFAERLTPQPLPETEEKPRRVLCFAQSAGLMRSARDEMKLLGGGLHLIWALEGEGYARRSADEYTVNYDSKEDILRCVQSIFREEGGLTHVLYLNPLEDGVFLKKLSPLIWIFQALGQAEAAGVHVLIAGACGTEADRPYADSLVGMDRSVGVTSLGASIGVIMTGGLMEDRADFLSLMLREALADTAESVVYENGVRKVFRIKPVALKADAPCCIRERGTYLITGGMGGLGLLFARHLSKRYRANLVLTGRRSADAVQEKLDALAAEGVSAIYVCADSCRSDQLRAAVEAAERTYGGLNGVIHAAGLPEGKNILEKEEAEFEKVLRPKIQGTLALEEALSGVPIDFICYFSSISAILGDFGSFDYSVGNRFMMRYARYRRESGRFAGKSYAIEWPFWHDGGMGFGSEAAERMYMRTSGQKGLTAGVGAALFDMILSSTQWSSFSVYGKPERISRTLGLSMEEIGLATVHFGEKAPAEEAPALQPAVPAAPAAPAAQAANAPAADDPRHRARIMEQLKDMIGQILGVARNEMDEDLFLADFGFDSVTLSGFAKKITEAFHVKVTPDLFYRYTTLNELADYFAPRCKVEAEEAPKAPPAQPVSEAPVQPAPEKAAPLPKEEGIAIVGMSGRFPDADDVTELWRILTERKETVHGAPVRPGWETWDGKEYQVRMGAIRHIDQFDPAFFEISPKEACFMDPRQRILLEEAWRALEDAGVGSEEIQNQRIGMFVGAEEGDYHLLSDAGSITANHNAVLAARIAYFLNLHGPNMCINTACSSGLVAFHQACQSLRTGECDIAIAAGVNLMCTPAFYDGMKKAGMLSESGSCYTFDRRADGMIPAEAVAVVVLKRMETARANRDRVYAEVIASAVNYDGRTNGITAPSGKAQTDLLEEVYRRFKVDPKTIDCLVAHGTGTRIGDPIELNAVTEVFQKANVPKGNCVLTSNKPNIGHSLAASGVVSLICLAMAMKNGIIPGEINCEEPSDYVAWDESPFVISKENRPFRDKGRPRVGAVNAFGMSGTNAHAVIRSVPEAQNAPPQAAGWLLALSAKSDAALKALCGSMLAALRGTPDKDFPAVCYTLLHGRQHFPHRLAIVAKDVRDAVRKLESAMSGTEIKDVYRDEVERNFKPKEKTLRIAEMLCGQVKTGGDAEKTLSSLGMLAQMYCKGILPLELYQDLDVVKTGLPGYPFERKSYWIPKGMEKAQPEKEQPKPSAPVQEKVPEKKPEAPAPAEAEPKAAEPVKPAKAAPPADGGKKDTERKQVMKQNVSAAPGGLSFEKILKDLASSLAAELFMDEAEVSYDRSFLEMGLDSIVGVEWIRHLNKTYHMEMESTRLYQHPTLAELAAYIFSLQAGETEESKQAEEEAEPASSEAEGKLHPLSDARYFEVKESALERPQITLEPVGAFDGSAKPAAPAQPAPKAAPARPALDVAETMKDLASSLAKELFMDAADVSYDQSFMEMGLDSIVGVEWIRYINKKFNIRIESTRLYEYPTVAELAQYIVSLSGGAAAEAPAAPAPKPAPAAESEPATKASAPQPTASEAAEGDDLDQLLEKIYNGEIDDASLDLF